MQMNIDVVKRDGLALRLACKQLSENRVCPCRRQNNGRAFYWASYDLRADKEIVLAAVKNIGRANRDSLFNERYRKTDIK